MHGYKTMMVRAATNDPIEGAMRILGDIQRFGLSVQTFALEAGDDRASRLLMTLSGPAGLDEDQLRARFHRHPCISSVQMEESARPRMIESREIAA
jgi:hypothetical protein